MDHLIDGILKYSSVQNARHVREKVSVDQIVKDIIKTIFIPSHVTVNIQPDMPVIKADPIRIQQLFQNLISNAVNYSNKENEQFYKKHIDKRAR